MRIEAQSKRGIPWIFIRIIWVGLFGVTLLANAQGIATVIAGSGANEAGYADNQPALQSRLSLVTGLALASGGDLFLSEGGRILRLHGTPSILTAVTGGGINFGDGPALSVNAAAQTIVMEKTGNLLFLSNATIRRLDFTSGTITTLAGRFNVNESTGDGGPATQALLAIPTDLALDSAGNIFVVENYGNRVRRIDATTGIITTVAGTGAFGFSGDGGPATAAILNSPEGICFDSRDNLYIADSRGTRIREVSAATGTIATIAGTGVSLTSGDGGPFSQASFTNAFKLLMDSGDNLYISDQSRVRRVSAASGAITTVAGTAKPGYSPDGTPGVQAEINPPEALAVDAAGNLYIGDGVRVRVISASTGLLSTIAGTSENGDGGTALEALLSFPSTLAYNATGDLFIGEGGNDIRRVDHATGLISTVPISTAGLQPPGFILKFHCLVVAPDGNILAGSTGAIFRVDSNTGAVSLFAGTGTAGFSGDGGPATSAEVGWISAMTYDAAGNLLIGESDHLRVRRIDAQTGVITTIAGNGQQVYSGDGIPAISSGLGGISGLAVDSKGDIFIAGTPTRLVKVTPDGLVGTAAGDGGCGYRGDGGDPRLAELCAPTHVVVDPADNLFIAEATCHCVRRIDAGSGIIQTVAGSGSAGTSSSGILATTARFQEVDALAFSGDSLLVADGLNSFVWSVTPPVGPSLETALPQFEQVMSAADFVCASLSPGKIITIFGNYLGPFRPGFLTIGSDGRVTTQLSGVSVLFDEIPAPLIYVSAGQINAIVPWGVRSTYPTVRVTTPSGSTTQSNSAGPVEPVAAGVFASAIVNQDGTLNSASNPAPKGSTITLYASGLGQTNPPAADGMIIPSTNTPGLEQAVPEISFSTNALLAGVPAQVLHAGPVPGIVAGLFQLNVEVPSSAPAGQDVIQIPTSCVSPPVIVK